MAFKRFVIDGYGQLELNNVAFRRDGRVEAQCFLDETDFADVPAENGMLLAVDRVNRAVKFANMLKVACLKDDVEIKFNIEIDKKLNEDEIIIILNFN